MPLVPTLAVSAIDRDHDWQIVLFAVVATVAISTRTQRRDAPIATD
jgi:hypothetical protein